MRIATTGLALLFAIVQAIAQQNQMGHPTKKLRKHISTLWPLHDRRPGIALDEFKKADKQDGGHCSCRSI